MRLTVSYPSHALPPPPRYHQQPPRSVAFHRTYPLFASSSDDGTVQVGGWGDAGVTAKHGAIAGGAQACGARPHS